MRSQLVTFGLGLITGIAVLFAACGAQQNARDQSVSFRDDNLARAEALHPAPAQENFPLRALLVEYTERQDLLNHPWYTYILGDNGNVVQYFVSTTLPVNACAFLSSTEDVETKYEGTIVLTAPSLDGIFYGGSGASAACTGWIVKDVSTDAMGVIYGDKLLVFDRPMILESEPVRIQLAPMPPSPAR